ncbi:MAG: galactose oxidase [Alteromonadaceae bacterium]|nr:galactose oxidase [Alteromonadaceae bacterium]
MAKLPALPEAVANNAIAKVTVNDETYLLTFMGLGAEKTYKDVHNKAWALRVGDNAWREIAPVPSSLTLKGRLASIAVGIGELTYIFGGYTVAKDHTEISSPDNFVYSVVDNEYTAIANTPVPVDDAIALVYQNRFIYLISGWHNDGNVNLTQVYDIKTNTWQQASPYYGEPTFGHAGGIVGNKMLVCDGVAVKPRRNARRTFAAKTQCFSGTIDQQNPYKIDWRIVEHPTGESRYRMAAVGRARSAEIIFIGGSNNPYNYNGIGYNGEPATPDNRIWIFNTKSAKWHLKVSTTGTMDHRGLIELGDRFYTIGGMVNKQTVIADLISYDYADFFK